MPMHTLINTVIHGPLRCSNGGLHPKLIPTPVSQTLPTITLRYSTNTVLSLQRHTIPTTRLIFMDSMPNTDPRRVTKIVRRIKANINRTSSP